MKFTERDPDMEMFSTSRTHSNIIDSSNTNISDNDVQQLNKVSHKISKPTRRNNTVSNNHQMQMKPRMPSSVQKPLVYTVDVSGFRELVQNLTGSPAHNRFSSPPPIPPPKMSSSRLQRNRPPPLPQIIDRQTSLMNNLILAPLPPPQQQPLWPLPPFPPIYTVADTPISAYMRCCLEDPVSTFGSDPNGCHSGFPPLVPLISPKWNNNGSDVVPPNEVFVSDDHVLTHVPVSVPVSNSSMFIPPFSPLPYGCQSPECSPGQLGFSQFPPPFT